MIWEQVEGLPIGGVLSGAVAALVLGEDEERYDRAWQQEDTKPLWASPRQTRDKTLGALRYVDDVLAMTWVLCEECTI